MEDKTLSSKNGDYDLLVRVYPDAKDENKLGFIMIAVSANLRSGEYANMEHQSFWSYSADCLEKATAFFGKCKARYID